MSKIDEFVEKWCLKPIECMKGDDYIIFAEDECRADLRSLIESLLPSKDEINKRRNNRVVYIRELGYPMQVRVKYGDAIEETAEWLCSRLLAAIDANEHE